jgi:hypothetical protein
MEGTSSIAHRHEFTLGGVISVAAEDETDGLLGFMVVEGGEVLRVCSACLFVCCMRIPGGLLLVGAVQRQEGGRRKLMEGGRSELGSVHGLLGEGQRGEGVI